MNLLCCVRIILSPGQGQHQGFDRNAVSAPDISNDESFPDTLRYKTPPPQEETNVLSDVQDYYLQRIHTALPPHLDLNRAGITTHYIPLAGARMQPAQCALRSCAQWSWFY